MGSLTEIAALALRNRSAFIGISGELRTTQTMKLKVVQHTSIAPVDKVSSCYQTSENPIR